MASLLMSAAHASPAPRDAKSILWTFDQTRSFNNHTCITTKKAPFTPDLCFGEKKVGNKFEGFAILRNAKKEILETYKVKPLSTWTFLYRTNDYVQNSDFYSRQILLTDESGRSSALEEVFEYYGSEFGKHQRIVTYKMSGVLPDGTRIDLNNAYFFYNY